MTNPATGDPMPLPDAAPVIAGTDGSAAALAAVRWAAAEAALRGSELRILHVSAHDGGHGGVVARSATEVLDEARRAALAERPGVTVRADDVRGDPARVQADAAPDGVLVVSRRGRGAVAGLVLGSVSRDVAARAAGPVVVVGTEMPAVPRPGGVVAAFDGSGQSIRAVEFAFSAARLRGARLTVVQAVPGSLPYRSPDLVPTFTPSVELEDARDRLAGWSAHWARRHPGVTADVRAVPGAAEDVLSDAAERAALLVLGSRGRGRVRGLLLGSVSQTLLAHSPAPVAVLGPGHR